MGQKDKNDISFDKLKLVPLDSDKKEDCPKVSKTSSKKAKFTVDKRSYKERRESQERRSSIRFQSERRKRADRRENTNWDTL